jgi:hypothetical protein
VTDAQNTCPGCAREVRCSATVPVVIDFDQLPDGRYLAWAVAASDEPVSEIEVSIVDDDGEYVSGQTFVGMVASISGQRVAVVHECAYGGSASESVAAP